MKIYGSIDALIEYSPPLQYLADPEDKEKKEDSLENLLHEKVRSLSDILGQISLEVNNREELSLNVIDKIYNHYSYLKMKLFELYSWELGRNKGIEIRRGKLETQLDSLKQEKRKEQVECWQDIAMLKKELRDWLKQYNDLMERVKIILPDKSKKLFN